MKILHITPHLGAGVGTVVLGYLQRVAKNKESTHKVVCLDSANKNAFNISQKSGFLLLDNMSNNRSKIFDLITEADIVLIHWWNHPLLSDFLVREKLPESRVVFWSHIVGSTPPNNFTDKVLKYPDLFVFTTPLSYKVETVLALPDEYKQKLRDIWSTSGLERVQSIIREKHQGFNIGYIGNIDYAKMHPDFIDICNQVNIPGVHFIVVGGPNGEQLRQETVRRGIADKFTFTGFVSETDKWKYLSLFDVFGYPLAPYHYGTCDQVLQESMGVGVVPVVLANSMESYMVQNNVTGIVAKSKEEYVASLEKLYVDQELRKSLSRNAKNMQKNNFL